MFSSVCQDYLATTLMLEQNPPERIFLYIYISKILSGGSRFKVEIVAGKFWQTLPKLFLFSLEIRVNFWRPWLGLADSLPSFVIHILNRLDMRIHQVSPKIYHTYQIIEKIAIEWSFFGLFLVISEVLYSENSGFQYLSVLGENYAFYHFVCHRHT